MRSLLDQCDPSETVVHLHGWTKSLSSSVIRAAVQRGFRLVVTLHEYFSACPNGGFFNYQTGRICHLKPLSYACVREHCDARSYSQKVWRVARQVVQQQIGLFPMRVDHCIALTRVSAGRLQPYLPPGVPITWVDNPTETERSQPVDAEGNDAFVFVGRLAPEKGCVLLAEAAREAGVKVLFVGDGPERPRILRACPQAEITGWLPGSEVETHLDLARALVLPSLWLETHSLVVRQALARGIPAVVPDTCAARELVTDGVTGLWFRGGDAGDLASKLVRLKEGGAVSALGASAYEKFWQEPPSITRHVQALERVYEATLRALPRKQAHSPTFATQHRDSV